MRKFMLFTVAVLLLATAFCLFFLPMVIVLAFM